MLVTCLHLGVQGPWVLSDVNVGRSLPAENADKDANMSLKGRSGFQPREAQKCTKANRENYLMTKL